MPKLEPVLRYKDTPSAAAGSRAVIYSGGGDTPVHNIVGSYHYGGGAAGQLIGLITADTLGLFTPSSSPGAAEAILKTTSAGLLTLDKLITVPASAATIPLVAKAASSQTANLQEWQNSGGTAYSYMNAIGQFTYDGSGNTDLIGATLKNASSGSSATARLNFVNDVAVRGYLRQWSSGATDAHAFELGVNGDYPLIFTTNSVERARLTGSTLRLTGTELERKQSSTSDVLLMQIDPSDTDSRMWQWCMNTVAQTGRDNVTLNWGYNNAQGGQQDSSDHSLYLQLESYWLTGGEGQAEFHLNYYGVSGANAFRPFTFRVNVDAIEAWATLLGDHIALQSRAGANGITVNPGSSIICADAMDVRATSTTAALIRKADLSANVFYVDTTNQRVGVNLAPSYPLHVKGASDQFRVQETGGQYLNLSVDGTGKATFSPSGGNMLFNSHLAFSGSYGMASHLTPSLTDTYDLGSNSRLWRKGWLSKLDAVVFAENTITLLGGWLWVPKYAGTAAEDIDTTETSIDLGADTGVMAVNDFIAFRQALKVEYMQLTAYEGSNVWTVTRNLDGSGANTWPQGAPYACLGYSGTGRIELDAQTANPRISMIRQGALYNVQTELLRIGDLNGAWDYESETWGVAIGEYTSGKTNLTLDPTNGFRVRSYSTARLELTPAGVLNVRDSGGTAVFTFDASAGAEFAAPLTLGSGGGIYQGTSGSFASPGTGLKIWNDSGMGRIAAYSGGTLQAGFDTGGAFTAGGGTITLDSTGMTVASGSSYPNAVFFHQQPGDGAHGGGIWGSGAAEYSVYITVRDNQAAPSHDATQLKVSSVDSEVFSIASDVDGTVEYPLLLTRGGSLAVNLGLYAGSWYGTAGNGEVIGTGDALFGGGIYLGGTSTDPGDGNVIATGDVKLDGGIYAGDKGGTAYTGMVQSTVGASGWLPFARYEPTAYPITTTDKRPWAVTIPRDITIRSWHQSVYVATTNDGSHYWTIYLKDAANNTISSFNTSAMSPDTWGTNAATSIDVSKGITDRCLYIQVTKTGSPGGLYLPGAAVFVT